MGGVSTSTSFSVCKGMGGSSTFAAAGAGAAGAGAAGAGAATGLSST